eukprot:SAG22_NODE_1497_length_4292_cov_4.207966_2_plen_826_part_00
MEEAGFDMQQVERLHESCLEQVSVDTGTCGRRILQRMDGSAGAAGGAMNAMIIPLTIVTNGDTGMLEVLSQNGRRSLQAGAEVLQQFRCECGTGTDISACLPLCEEEVHGFELLLTIDQTDVRVSCKLHAGLYSWAGAVSEGSYFGDDAELFVSTLVSGAAGRYILKLRVSADVGVELTVQRNQEVKIAGDRALPVPPRWGRGSFEVMEGGSLALEYVAFVASDEGAGGSAAVDQLTVQAGGMLSVADSLLLQPAAAWAQWAQPVPLPCDVGLDGICARPHFGPAVLEVAGVVSLAAPLVCGSWSDDCRLTPPAGVTATQHAAGVAAGIPWNADAVCFLHGVGEEEGGGGGGGGYVAVPDDPNLLVGAGQGRRDDYPNYNPTMPPGWRCDAAEGITGLHTDYYDGEHHYDGEGHGPFGLNRSTAAWYRLPVGKGLPTAPPESSTGAESCGTGETGWLSGWPARQAGQPDDEYATPADGSLPPPVGAPPAAGTVCFGSVDGGDGDTCYSHTPVRAVSCGAFALWELPPAPGEYGCLGYCLAPDPCAGCAAAGRCAAESWGGPPLGATCVNDDSTSDNSHWGVTCSSHYDAHPDECGRHDDDDFTAATQCCACGGGFHDADHLGYCACAAGWAGPLCADALPPAVAGLPQGVSRAQYDRAVAAGVDPGADPVCFTAEFVTVPDDPDLQTSAGQGGDASWGYSPTYDPGMPPTYRCDAAEGTDLGFYGEGHGPFGLRQDSGVGGGGGGGGNDTRDDTRWYQLPAGKGLPTAPPGWDHCGTGDTGWLSGWPARAEGQLDAFYATPADGSLPPPVGSPLTRPGVEPYDFC